MIEDPEPGDASAPIERAIDAVLRDMTAGAPPSDLRARVMSRLSVASMAKGASAHRPAAWHRGAVPLSLRVAVAAGIVGVVVAAFVWRHQPGVSRHPAAATAAGARRDAPAVNPAVPLAPPAGVEKQTHPAEHPIVAANRTAHRTLEHARQTRLASNAGAPAGASEPVDTDALAIEPIGPAPPIDIISIAPARIGVDAIQIPALDIEPLSIDRLPPASR